MAKINKNDIISNIKDVLANVKMLILLKMHNINAHNTSILRNALNKYKLNIKIFKNTFVKLAIKHTNISSIKNIKKYLHGQVFFIWSVHDIDVVNIVKMIQKKFKKLEISCFWYKSNILSNNHIKDISDMSNLLDIIKIILKKILYVIYHLVYLLKHSILSILNILNKKSLQ